MTHVVMSGCRKIGTTAKSAHKSFKFCFFFTHQNTHVMTTALLTEISYPHAPHLTQKNSMAAWQSCKQASHLFCRRGQTSFACVCVYVCIFAHAKRKWHIATTAVQKERRDPDAMSAGQKSHFGPKHCFTGTLMLSLYPGAFQTSCVFFKESF